MSINAHKFDGAAPLAYPASHTFKNVKDVLLSDGRRVKKIFAKWEDTYAKVYEYHAPRTYELYGFKFDSGASTAATAITYLEDAVGKTPAGMNMGGTTTTVTSEIESGAIAGDGTEVSDSTCVRMVDMWPISTAKYTFSWTSSSTLLAKVYAYNFMTGTFISELTDGWTANDITLQVTSPIKIRVMFRADPSAPISSSIVTGMTLTTVPYFSYGDWENAFFMPRPCMLKYDGTVDYYLDPDDYAHKADDGSIPAGYKAVEYIESTGSQYIDTNIGVSSYTDMTVDLMFKAGARTSTSGNVVIFGVGDSLVDAAYAMNYGGSGENKLFFWCGYGASGSFPYITAEYERLHDVHFEFKNMRVDATTSTTGPSSPCQILPADNLRLFGMGGYTPSVYNISTLRIYSFKVTEKVNNVDTVTHNLIPAERQSDGELGMYDTVTGDFYTNSGTGTFLKGGYGIASDIEREAYPGNAMMEWPKIWYKFETGENPGEGYFYVADTKVDNTYHCWCNYDALDNEIEHFYTAIYNSQTKTILRSLSGINLPYWDPFLRSLNERAHANNVNGYVEWQLEVFADRQLIDALIMLIGKSANVTSVFGNGLYGQSGSAQALLESYTTGTLNDKGLFWGDTSSGDNAVKIFGMENWWGLQSRVVNGILYVIDPAAKLYYKLTYGTADGSEATGYATSSINQFLSINTNAAMDRDTGYITALTFANGIYYPSGVSSTNNIWDWKFAPYVTYPQASKLFTYGGNIWDSVRSPNGIALHYSGDDDYTFGGNLCCKPVAQITT